MPMAGNQDMFIERLDGGLFQLQRLASVIAMIAVGDAEMCVSIHLLLRCRVHPIRL